jgi:hypothetical protein
MDLIQGSLGVNDKHAGGNVGTAMVADIPSARRALISSHAYYGVLSLDAWRIKKLSTAMIGHSSNE